MNTEHMVFHRFTVGSYPINGYLIMDRESRTGAFIDPGGFDETIQTVLKKLQVKLQCLLITHGHYDHTEGLAPFLKNYAPKVYAGPGEVANADVVLSGGEEIPLGARTVRAIATPGHTPGGMSYAVENVVFTGDALFCGTIGGTSTPEEHNRQLATVRRGIFSLPEHTLLYPGHGPMSTIASEKYHNPFFIPEE